MVTISFTLNGEPCTVTVNETERLLDVLRDRLFLTGTKEGCGIGECGACTVIVDGRNVNACLTMAPSVDGRSVITIEGVAQNEELAPIQKSILQHHAFQCGFCTPGIIMTATALLDKNPNPSEEEVRDARSGNYCRCISQYHVFEAIASVAGRGVELDEKWEGRR